MDWLEATPPEASRGTWGEEVEFDNPMFYFKFKKKKKKKINIKNIYFLWMISIRRGEVSSTKKSYKPSMNLKEAYM